VTALVLADDATGALECASLLAGYSQQAWRVVDTQSRHLPPAEAAAAIRPYANTPQIYKKTDSTFRGNIAAELTALLPRTVVYIPAYPNLGRTVVNGQLLIHGIPVAETDFARDPRHPIHSSTIADLLPNAIPIPNTEALKANLHQPAILICDASTNEDLAEIAKTLNKNVIIASPAGFIPHWAKLCELPEANPPQIPTPQTWLVIRGSRHPQSIRQSQHAKALQILVIEAPETTHANPDTIAEALAQTAKSHIERHHPQGVLIMGGDTVFALWRALGITQITPLPERLPGIAASWSPQTQILFLTKAGGFGHDTLVEQLLHTS
jgi:uncharacterized protein YgbK (DUF1537 family)